MADRAAAAAAFLAGAGWSAAARRPLAGDASARRYERLSLAGRSTVLMDAPPGRGEDVTRFTRMARWLSARGFSAPAILAEDAAAGFLLLEDLGDALFARLAAADPAQELPLYAAATDVLVELHRHAPPDFVLPLDGPALADLVRLTPDWYLPGIGAAPNPAAGELPGLIAALHDRLADDPPVPALRDFHAENLIWLPQRQGSARVGLLDFQDAVAAHPAYDLVSLLQDARRDVPEALEAAMIARYCARNRLDQSRFSAAYALLGAQRGLRILGVFARLSMHFGKPHYVDLIPRVWRAIRHDLAHPALAELAACTAAALPAPTPERLQRIKDQCASCPTP